MKALGTSKSARKRAAKAGSEKDARRVALLTRAEEEAVRDSAQLLGPGRRGEAVAAATAASPPRQRIRGPPAWNAVWMSKVWL